MTLFSILKLAILIPILFSLIFLMAMIEYGEAKYRNPLYLSKKISEKENLLNLLLKSKRDNAEDIYNLRLEISELYGYLKEIK